MDVQKQIALLNFTQNERFHLLKRVRKNMNIQIIFILLGLSVIFNDGEIFKIIMSNILPDKSISISNDKIALIIPFVLFFQFVSFGYLLGLFTKNAAVIRLLILKIMQSEGSSLSIDDRNNIINMSGAYTFLQPYVSEEVFKEGGRLLKYIYNFLLTGFVFLNHFVTFNLISILVENTNNQRGIIFFVFLVNMMFFYHFFRSIKTKGTKRFVVVTVLIELAFVYYILQSST